MLNKIVEFSLKNKLLIISATLIMALAGIYTSKNMDIDVFPDLTAPTVVVMTDANGMAAEEVERLVTFPIETAVNGATGVRRVRSTSQQGSSFVWVEFDWGTDVYKARQIVSEKMASLSSIMPTGVAPVLAPQSSIMGEIMFIGLQSDSTSLMDLRSIADWVMKPAILATGGVSQVTNIGGDYKQYQVLVNTQMAMYLGVSMQEIEDVCRNMSQNSNGGILRQFGNEYMIRGIARSHSIEELEKSTIKLRNNQPITVADVAEVKITSAQKTGYASQNGKPAVLLSVSKQPNSNTLDVTKRVEQNLNELKKTLPADVKMDTEIFRQSEFIESSIKNVETSLIEGAILVIIILFVFLGSLRTTIISALAIPLSLLGAIIILKFLGIGVNTMTLGGMCIAIGSLVDDAIIDVENVYKRLRQNHAKSKEQRKSAFAIVLEGSIEIRSSILNATFIIIVAFLPLFFLSGMEGRMLKPLGISYIVSLLMSLVVAMTVTPLLCRLMLSNEKYLSKKEKETKLNTFLSDLYRRTLTWALGYKKPIFLSTVFVFVVALILMTTMGRSFLPEFNEGALTISAVCKPGVSLEESNILGNQLEKELLKIPEVKSTARRTGRGELSEHSQSSNTAEIDVKFNLDKRSHNAFMHDVRDKLASVPGITTTVGQPLGHRIDHILSGTRANIAIKIFGNDLSKLFSLGNQIKTNIDKIEGLVDVSVEQQIETPQLQIRANRDRLMRYGITIGQFNSFVNMAFSGTKVGEIYEGQRNFDLLLKLENSYTQNIDAIKTTLIDVPGGGKVPLEEVAEIVSAGGPNSISRENVQRKIVVSANVAGRDLQSVVNDIQNRIGDQIKLPNGYRIEYGGQFESAQKAARILFLVTMLSIIIIFLLLFMEFRSLKLSGIILLNLPLALIGGIFAVFFSSGVISIPSIIGFITLFGIATRNGILLISNYQRLDQGSSPDSKASRADHNLIIKASLDRLNPILMTALTAGLALVPMVINGDKPGNEIQSPMAIVILGGLITSTFLNMYLIPIVYSWLNKKNRTKYNETH